MSQCALQSYLHHWGHRRSSLSSFVGRRRRPYPTSACLWFEYSIIWWRWKSLPCCLQSNLVGYSQSTNRWTYLPLYSVSRYKNVIYLLKRIFWLGISFVPRYTRYEIRANRPYSAARRGVFVWHFSFFAINSIYTALQNNAIKIKSCYFPEGRNNYVLVGIL